MKAFLFNVCLDGIKLFSILFYKLKEIIHVVENPQILALYKAFKNIISKTASFTLLERSAFNHVIEFEKGKS